MVLFRTHQLCQLTWKTPYEEETGTRHGKSTVQAAPGLQYMFVMFVVPGQRTWDKFEAASLVSVASENQPIKPCSKAKRLIWSNRVLLEFHAWTGICGITQ